MSISLYDGGASTIVILPLVAMHEEYISRAKQYGLTCKTWTSNFDFASAPQLLLVAIESCSWPHLQAHVRTLIRLGRLARIVIDEIHLLLKHEPFRPCMGRLAFFGTLAIPLVLMTATCPKSLESELFKKLGRKVYQVLRRSTDRPEISQEVIPIQANAGKFEEIVANNITSATRLLKDTERALLFCNSRDECDRMARLLPVGWRPYHSSISVEERSEEMKLWKDGTIVFGLAATSMLNCCLDYPSIRYIFHLGPPRDVIDYYQAIGRSARAGGIGKSIIYFDPSSLTKPMGDDPFGRGIIYDMLRDKSLCRRLRPSFFLDGIGIPCVMLPGAQLCDICMTQSSSQFPDPGLHRIPDHLAPGKPVDAPAQLTPRFNQQNQPAPSATFATHLAAANASLVFEAVRPTEIEDSGHSIHVACEGLVKSCVSCWCNGLEHHSHRLTDCLLRSDEIDNLQKWASTLRLPVGCCFYCGCPQKVRSHGQISFYTFSDSSLDDLFSGFWSETSSSWPFKRSDLPLGCSVEARCIYCLSQSRLD